MALKFSQLPSIANGRMIRMVKDRPITEYITDSRKHAIVEGACFFAIKGTRHDGHQFITALYTAGIRQFVVEQELSWDNCSEANFFLAASALDVLQKAAAFHRQQFRLPVIGITGSNAKTIVKEWLYQLLSPDFNIVKNPGSYNSQLGVPLSVLQTREHHNLGIFEAGISKPGEMKALASIIQPSVGLFTNIGSSHDEGFHDRSEKIREKLELFRSCETIIYCADHSEIDHQVKRELPGVRQVGWGSSAGANIKVKQNENSLSITFENKSHEFKLHFRENAQRENVIHCIVAMLVLGIHAGSIAERLKHLKGVPMRMELKQGMNHCVLIDDTYNNDVAGLKISLDFLSGQQKTKKVLILSDIQQSGLGPDDLAKRVADMIRAYPLSELIAVGPLLSAYRKQFAFIPLTEFYPDTEALLSTRMTDRFRDAAILVKGARSFQFEKVVNLLERKIHGTVMEIDLAAVVSNLNFFRSRLKAGVRLMVMVKAFAYGSGSEEVATLLQYHGVDYLGVAYPDEGAELRRNNIRVPIMVMNPTEESFGMLLDNQLEPEIYNLRILRSLIAFLAGRPCHVHLKIDSGMHRLGFGENEISELAGLLKDHPEIKVVSVFTHLAGSDEPEHDAFSRLQADSFKRMSDKLASALRIEPMRHVLNSPGILRFPDLQFEMVRLGIGLYGIDPTNEGHKELQPVATLKTIISQIKSIPAGDTVGYGRHGLAKTEMKLATIAIGYADGFSRSHSRGTGAVLVHGKKAKVVGNVCMDMTMIDITGIDAQEGDEVIVFGPGMPISEVAARIGTIPYEILTTTSERVKRVFHTESV